MTGVADTVAFSYSSCRRLFKILPASKPIPLSSTASTVPPGWPPSFRSSPQGHVAAGSEGEEKVFLDQHLGSLAGSEHPTDRTDAQEKSMHLLLNLYVDVGTFTRE